MGELAGVYGRQSKDKQRSISQQLEIGQSDCQQEGWGVYDTYQDGISASRFSGKAREDWARLLEDLRASRFQVLWLWESSRGDRDLGPWVQMLADCRDRGVRIYVHTHDRLYDLRNARDWKALVEDGLDSAYESEKTSLRVLRDTQARAEAGRPHGKVSYGWKRGKGTDTLIPAQAKVIRDTANKLLEGESLRSIVADLNARKIPSPTGGTWSSTKLRDVMLRDRNAGLRVHRGQVFGTGNWKPIYDEATHLQVKSLLTAPERLSHKGTAITHLLTGVKACGLCGGRLRFVSGRPRKDRSPIPPGYQCRECFKLQRSQELMESKVNTAMIDWLENASLVQEMASGAPDEYQEALRAKEALEKRMELAADQYTDGEITGDQLKRITARATAKIQKLDEVLATSKPMPGLVRFLEADDVAQAWYDTPIDVRRQMIQALLTITIHPSGKGKTNPDSVQVEVTGSIGELVESGAVKVRRRV